MHYKELGSHGEQLVVDHLIKEGFFIRACNYTERIGEIDIIAQKKELLVFVEVKLRQTTYFATSEVIIPSKQRKIIATALRYIAKNGLQETIQRFDVALVTYANALPTLTYIPNAFTAAVCP